MISNNLTEFGGGLKFFNLAGYWNNILSRQQKVGVPIPFSLR